MHMPDHESPHNCRVIPFKRPTPRKDNILTSSIATVIVVRILHREGETPEERLFDIIERSGEAEIFDVEDVLDEHEKLGTVPKPAARSDNDNGVITLL